MPSSASLTASSDCAGTGGGRERAAGELERQPREPADAARGELERARLGRGRPRLALVRGGGCGIGVASNSTVIRSTPEMPSTSAWWDFEISAKRPRSSPCTSHVSHSGLARSSRCEWMRAASARSCSSEPGCGSAVWRTWYSRLKLRSSTQIGRPVSSGGNASLWR